MYKQPTYRASFKQFDKNGTNDLDEWRKIFVELCDPTEYDAAIVLLGSWTEWQKMKKLWPSFREIILKEWLDEVEIKLRSQGIKSLCKHAMTDKGSTAAKWIAEGRFNTRKAGKPSKAEVEREAKIAAGVEEEVDDDVERVLQFSKGD